VVGIQRENRPAFVKSLNSYLLIASMTLLSGVVAFGAAALMNVNSVSEKARMIGVEARHVALVGRLQNQTYQLLLLKHQHLLDPQDHLLERATSLLVNLRHELADYIAYEEAAQYPESAEEARLLRDLDSLIQDAVSMAAGAGGSLPGESAPHVHAEWLLQQQEQIAALLQEINTLHFEIIARKIGLTEGHFSALFNLFLALSSLGLMIVWLGFTLHSRYVVRPVRKLADLAGLLAQGDLSVRADTRSRTEIGVLYRAFNNMAETIQRHEEDLSNLTHELERRVADRTRSLEQAYDSLQRTQADLVRMERLATLGEIATTVNHEIKTPLNALYINLQLLKRRARESLSVNTDTQAEILELVTVIDREVHRISSYLDEFVRFARFPPSRPRHSDANRIVREVMDMFSQKAEQAGVRMQAELDPRLPPLLLDERKIAQALINLIANAIDAMPQGGTLLLATREDGDCGLIEVSDTGRGIGASDRTRIFTPFFTRKETGLGFGLPIVQRIAEDHGGSISCISQPGHGSTFTLRLPISGSVSTMGVEPASSDLACSTS
jgi:signal transduction histidine kinase